MYLLDDSGRLVDSEFSLDVDSGRTCVVVESSGGANPSAGVERRNPHYNALVNILLTRIGRSGALISRIVLESKIVEGLPIEDRTAHFDVPYPIRVNESQADELRRMIGRTIAGMHRADGAKSRGNAQKRIRIFLDSKVDADALIGPQSEVGEACVLDAYAPGLGETERSYLRKARIGQGGFREALLAKFRNTCPVTGITHSDLLVASHIKPWRVCSNVERLDPENGILLSGLVDRLFDAGLITFDASGCIVVSTQLSPENAAKCGLASAAKIKFSNPAERYMIYHRDAVFQK